MLIDKTMVCERCSYKWFPRKAEIRMCPKCKSVNFDKPRKIAKAKVIKSNPKPVEDISEQFSDALKNLGL